MQPADPVARTACPCPVCHAMPPYMEEHLERTSKDRDVLEALAALKRNASLIRLQRAALMTVPQRASLMARTPVMTRRIYSCGNTTDLLAKLVRKEGRKPTPDAAVTEAYDFSGKTFDFFATVFARASIDNANLPLTSSVHYQEDPRFGYDNAFWNGNQMVYGDGYLFNRMTACLDVAAHELVHGITQYEAGLRYELQSGALNEHMSDVFGVLTRQWAGGERDAATADWTIGKGIFRKPTMAAMSLRSMSAPGTAYDDVDFGTDPQPAHMRDFVVLPNTAQGDWGGVHYNSGIPNKAFHLSAVALGGPAWDVAGKVWYVALTERLRDNADFRKCAFETISVANDYFGVAARTAVERAWVAVGVIADGEGPGT